MSLNLERYAQRSELWKLCWIPVTFSFWHCLELGRVHSLSLLRGLWLQHQPQQKRLLKCVWQGAVVHLIDWWTVFVIAFLGRPQALRQNTLQQSTQPFVVAALRRLLKQPNWLSLKVQLLHARFTPRIVSHPWLDLNHLLRRLGLRHKFEKGPLGPFLRLYFL